MRPVGSIQGKIGIAVVGLGLSVNCGYKRWQVFIPRLVIAFVYIYLHKGPLTVSKATHVVPSRVQIIATPSGNLI